MEGFIGNFRKGEDVAVGLVEAMEFHFVKPNKTVTCLIDKLPTGEKADCFRGSGKGYFPFSNPGVFLKYKVLRGQNMNLRL